MSAQNEEHAEASIRLSAESFAAVMAGDGLATARIAGILAAKRMPELIPLRPSGAPADITILFEPTEPPGTSIRIIAASISSDTASARMQALTAASLAALTLYDIAADSTAVINGVRLAPDRKKNDLPRRAIGMGNIVSRDQGAKPAQARARVKPEVLMGEVAAPSAAPDSRRAAFRNFMTSKRLRPTTWAKDAGVSTGEIMGFLTGRSRGFSGEVAEKLARVARVSVEDMFR